MVTQRKAKTIIFLIILLGFSLRIYHLEQESLWLDEGESIRVAYLPPGRIIEEISKMFHPPAYFLILHGWITILGDSVFSVRLLSIMAGAFSIFMIYRLGSNIFDRRTGVAAALLLAVSSFHIFYSRDARMYSLLVLLALLSMYYFIMLARGRGTGYSICYIIFSALLLYTHNLGIFIIIAQNIYYAGRRLLGKNRSFPEAGRWLILQGILILLYLPWLYTAVGQLFARSQTKGWWINMSRPRAVMIWYTLRAYSGSRAVNILYLFLSLLAVTPSLRTGFRIDRNNLHGTLKKIRPTMYFPSGDRIALLLAWLLTPIIFPFIISHFIAPIYIIRVTIGASPALYLLAARGTQRIPGKYFKYLALLAVLIFIVLNLRWYYIRTYKDNWRDLTVYLDSYAVDGDLVICDPPSSFRDIFSYYWRRTGLVDKQIATRIVDITPANIGKVLGNIKDIDRIWVVLSYQGLDDEELIKEKMEGLYYRAREKTFYNRGNVPSSRYGIGLKVYLFVRKLKPDKVGKDDIPLFTGYLAGEENHNLIENSGFEGEGRGWSNARKWITGDMVHTGSGAIHIRKNTVPRSNFYFLIQGPIKLKSDYDYIFGAFIKTKELRDDIRVEIRKINPYAPDIYQSTRKISGDNDWTLLLGVFRAGSEEEEEFEIDFRPARLNNFQEGEFWVDDAFIIPYNLFPRY